MDTSSNTEIIDFNEELPLNDNNKPITNKEEEDEEDEDEEDDEE